MAPALRLEALSTHHFRNLAEHELSPHPRFTLILGENGQGKTNLLEAVHYALTLRPLRQAKLAELIQHGSPEAVLRLRVAQEGVANHFALALTSAGRTVQRTLQREGKGTEAQEYLLAGACVSFTPDDLALIRQGPERRRRALDRMVFNRWPAYLGEARTYQRLLKARNALLRQRASPQVRESFDAQLWPAGARVALRRHALLAELRPQFAEAFTRIGLMETKASLRSTGPGSADSDPDNLAEELATQGRERLALDAERGFTSVGPHADDLAFALAGRSARLYASQGQARALVLALKVAEIENLRTQLGRAPVLLLDDVSSELDPRRNASFMAYLRDLPSQVLLTTTDDAALGPSLEGEKTRWRMSQGLVTTE